MNRITCIFCTIALLLCSCGKPKVIPEDKLSQIIRDILITNAYSNIYMGSAINDTVDIYTPIFKKYGYTDRDFRYSLGKLEMKKSSRITEVIDLAIADISRQNDYFTARKIIRERIDSLANEMFKDTVYVMDTAEIKITSLTKKDRERLVINIPVKKGNYSVRYGYIVDSTDLNPYTLMRYNITDSLQRTTKVNSMSLMKGGRKTIEFKVETSAKDRELTIKLADHPETAKKPHITFDSIYIIYYEPLESSRKKLTQKLLNFNPQFDVTTKKDSGALYIVPPLRADTARRTDIR